MANVDSVVIVPKIIPPTGTKLISVASSLNGPQPTISQYIAFDTAIPPNPFIAVTQDGLGNVVYDGGFPKFYNAMAAGATPGFTFSQLSPAFKYLYNAILFTANQAKFTAGNRKILFIGDALITENYAIKDTGPNDFFTSFSNICSILNLTPTFKDPSDYGGILNPTSAELSQYALAVIMSSRSSGVVSITDEGVNAFIDFRSNGNGLIIITDHGNDLPTIQDAVTSSSGFFVTANKITVNFGAWFSSTVDRVPINVGFLRQQYGDHPLYNGLLDSEDFPAGGSESRVFVNEVTPTPANAFYSYDIVNPGPNSVRFLFIYEDGTSSLASVSVELPGSGTNQLWGTNPTALPAADLSRSQVIYLEQNANNTRNTILGEYTWNDTLKQFTYQGTSDGNWAWKFKVI